ncbi:MAG: pitrilysin family protein [Pseudomonas sp.]|uniref:M16 family metallopeptidase n=1 Tax=Pseudomonas abieticivorans TaxID=2931382 RepID=UPI0020BEEE03|nr:pitrilysin family protein [Pseudomonas sp. PIA16]MDE1168464.1 pitrilysin family protein [Pseudomonas sp.]
MHITPAFKNILDVDTANRHLDLQRWKTAEGTRVLFAETHDEPLVTIRLDFAAGSCRDGEHPGLSKLTNSMLDEGISEMNAEQLASAFKELNAEYRSNNTADLSCIGLQFSSAPLQRDAAVSLLAQVVGRPSLRADSFNKMQTAVVGLWQKEESLPGTRFHALQTKHIYNGHPYFNIPGGSSTEVAARTLEQVRTAHHENFGASNLTVTLVGDLSRDDAQAMINTIIAQLPASPKLAALPAPVWPGPDAQHYEEPTVGMTGMITFPSVNRAHPDHVALTVANHIFGNSGDKNSRLMREVHIKRNLYKRPSSTLHQLGTVGEWSINWRTREQYREASRQLLTRMLEDFLRDGPTAEELAQACSALLGSYPLHTVSHWHINTLLQPIAIHDLPLDTPERFARELMALTPHDIVAAMNRHYVMDQLLYTSMGPTVDQQPLPPLAHE